MSRIYKIVSIFLCIILLSSLSGGMIMAKKEISSFFEPKVLVAKKAVKVDINSDGKKERVRFFVKKTKKGKYKLTLYVNKKLRFSKVSTEKNWSIIIGNDARVILVGGASKEGEKCTSILCYQYKKKKMNLQQDVMDYLVKDTPYEAWKGKNLVQGANPVTLNQDGGLKINLSFTAQSLGDLQSNVTLTYDDTKKQYIDDSTNYMELEKSEGTVVVKAPFKMYNVPNANHGKTIPANQGETIKLVELFIKDKESAFVEVKIRSTIAYIGFNQFFASDYFEELKGNSIK